jgi:hypothetical protein
MVPQICMISKSRTHKEGRAICTGRQINILCTAAKYTRSCLGPFKHHTDLTWLEQIKAIGAFFGEDAVTANTANYAMNLTATGAVTIAPSAECKLEMCVRFTEDSYLRFPAHNLGQYNGLTFALWFKPTTDTGQKKRLLDFGSAAGEFNVVIAQHDSTDALSFAVTRGTTSRFVTRAGAFKTNEWRHVAWVLERIPATQIVDGISATWSIYIGGELAGSTIGLYPADVELQNNYIGKGNLPSAEVSPYVGYMDSFWIYPLALNANEILNLFTVSASRRCEL